MEQQFCTSDCEIQAYLAYDPILTAVISLEVTTASSGASELECISQEVQK